MPIRLKGYFSNSIIGRWILLICIWYHHSQFKILVDHWQKWASQSKTQAIWNRYIDKTPRYIYSKAFAITKWIEGKTKPFFDGLHRIFKNSKILSVFMTWDYQHATYLLAFYAFINFFMKGFFSGHSLEALWDELLLLGCIALWGYKLIANPKDSKYHWTPLDIPLLIFIGLGITHVSLNALELRVGIDGIRAVAQHMLWFFPVVQLLRTKEGAKRLFIALVLAGTIMGAHGIFQYITGAEMLGNWVDSTESIRTRAYSIVYSPNVLGSVMTLFAPMALSLAFAEKSWIKKGVYLGSTGIMSLCLLLTFSRGAWLGFGIALLFFFIMKDKRFIIPLLVGGLLIYLFVPSISNRILYMLSSAYWQRSAEGGRVYRWVVGWETLKEGNIWFGLGLGRYGGAVAMNYDLSPFYMDNYYMKTLVEMGFFGLGLLFFLLYQVLIWGYRTVRLIPDIHDHTLVQGALAGLLGVMIHNFGENIFEVPMMVTYFWVIVGFIMFMRNQYQSPVTDKIG